MINLSAEKILASRSELMTGLPVMRRTEEAAEGGCGVLGFAANIPVAGRHVLAASRQMHNRGNGKGGGIAMVGLAPAQAGVGADILSSHYLLQIALLDPAARHEVEETFIRPYFDIAAAYELAHVEDFRQVDGLDIRPPDVWRYFVRVKHQVLQRFAQETCLVNADALVAEDEFVYQNSFRLNKAFYASLGEKRAFVLSHGRNLSVLKIVGYAEQVVEYYCLQDQTAHVWIAHQRYPTKGRVWHPGGAHPFIGLNEALVHNGDFANYHAVSEYLRQRNIGQLFLTDTEVSVQLFDLWDRVYGYPLEITLEAMAPTTEFDFEMLSAEKQHLYQAVQRSHIHGSPDGPWFFIVARSVSGSHNGGNEQYELIGITDTSMLRPQVFALYENNQLTDSVKVQIGLIASERQAINACLRSLAAEDHRFQPHADRYWAARGGSHTDGGAFRFTVTPSPDGSSSELLCRNKYGLAVALEAGRQHVDPDQLDPHQVAQAYRTDFASKAMWAYDDGGAPTMLSWLRKEMPKLGWDELAWGFKWLVDFAAYGDGEWHFTRQSFTSLRDARYDLGDKKRASLLRLLDEGLASLFGQAPLVGSPVRENGSGLEKIRRIDWESRHLLAAPHVEDSVLLLDVQGFPPEGDQAAARILVDAYELGWKWIIAHNWQGGRFAGAGLGPDSKGLRLDLYGDAGDYAGSGLDGAEIYLHGDGQDQLGQILKDGRLVIYGDAGQTFLYGAKGGEVFVLGSVAGRPLINAVGKPRAVINGTCLDYLAESFMAGDPHQGGGFVILNGVAYHENGQLSEMESPYPGGNLFSLASGGAIYLRDPGRKVGAGQLNGGILADLIPQDWALIEPYLQKNEELFGIRVQDLLTVDGQLRSPYEVYRKVVVRGASVLQEGQNN